MRALDQQQRWIDGIIAEINAITTPPTRPRIHRAHSVGDIAPNLFLVESESESESDDEDPFSLEEVEDSDDDLECHSVITTFYHSDTWGVHPRGVDRGLEWWQDGYESDDEADSDAETVVCEWEDPSMTPMKRLAPVAAGYYSPFDDYLE